jgi:RimJ/RimL family protein N-acetyltransferase
MAHIDSKTCHLKDGTEVILRTGVENDAPSLLLTLSTYIAENEGMVWEPDEYRKSEKEIGEWIRGMLENPREILILATLEGEIIGNIDFHAGARKRIAHVGELGMGMLPAFRSRGLGSLLLNRLMQWVERVPELEKINLNVIATNERAIGLYKKFGFQEEGRRLRELKYSHGSYADSILMAKIVRPAPIDLVPR